MLSCVLVILTSFLVMIMSFLVILTSALIKRMSICLILASFLVIQTSALVKRMSVCLILVVHGPEPVRGTNREWYGFEVFPKVITKIHDINLKSVALLYF